MELERRLNLKMNYMQLETKLGWNTIEIKFVQWYTWAKGDIMIHFSKIIWATWKNPGKESMNFYIDGKET